MMCMEYCTLYDQTIEIENLTHVDPAGMPPVEIVGDWLAMPE